MEIYLMQHGPALPKEQDPEEGLGPEGEARISASGQALKKMGAAFDMILSSPKKRSRQTAAIVAQAVGFPLEKIIETKKVKAMAPPEETVQALSELSGAQRVLIAGHLPSVAEVASFLLTEGSKATVQFEMGGCCRIDVEELPTHSGRLRWYLTPAQLKLIAS
ncbi:MAG: phosphohistidine phosphatase SixA [Desulfobacterales bacterium S5133MH4]|nr:MAG: phosphohistidine phosphatase SixA [Desulfobacterales bacterium S5133MH4]